MTLKLVSIVIEKYMECATNLPQFCPNCSDILVFQPSYMPPEDPAMLPEVVASCDQRHCYLSCRLGKDQPA